jgi:O-antigen ligase
VRALKATFETPALTAAAAAVSAATAFVLVEAGPAPAIALAAVPLAALTVVYLLTSGQAVLYAAAIVLPISAAAVVSRPVAGSIYLQDVIAALALAACAFTVLFGRGRVPPLPHTPVLGWPFVLFAAVILSATLRGHYAHGASLMGQPLRLFLYAAIIAGLAGMTVTRLHRLLVALFYPGAAVAALVALYYLVTGGSATDQGVLSTGGTRLLGISTSLYCAGALFLALLNLTLTRTNRERMLDLAVAGIATFGVAAGFGRAAYAGTAIVCTLLFLTSPRLRRSFFGVVPLAVPLLVVLAIGVGKAAPQLAEAVGGRTLSSPEADANVEWRLQANRAVFEQVREQPLFGVGFGKTAEFFRTADDPTTGVPAIERVEIGQDPHNGYIFLLAGGGIAALGSFILLLAVFAGDAIRRYRRNSDPIARLILLWSCATLFVFLLNAASGTSFANAENLLTIWALLVLPAVVPPRAAARAAPDGVRATPPDRTGRSARPALPA